MRAPLFHPVGWQVMALTAVTGALASAQPASPSAWAQFQARSATAMAELQSVEAPPPAATSGATPCPLEYAVFFLPMSEAGLELSPRARALAGRRVRVTGYIVREGRRPPGGFLLTAQPLSIDPSGSGETADLPPVTVHVRLGPGVEAQTVGWKPGRTTVEGELDLGPQTDAHGRVSVLRLHLDAAASAALVTGGKS